MAKLAALQTDCAIGDIGANVGNAVELINEAGAAGADLAVLPECFSTGLPADLADLAEVVPGATSEALCAAAAGNRLWLVAGVAEKTDEGVANTALVINPQGVLVARYHKRFLYMAEADVFTRGSEGLVVDMGFVTAGITICYDYMFPEYTRALVDAGARLIAHSTAWITTDLCEQWGYDARRMYPAQSITRAVENGVFLVTANHCGTAYDAAGCLRPVGKSCIIAPWGEILAAVDMGPGVAVADVDFADADRWAADAAPYLEDHRLHPIPPINSI